MKNFIFFVFGLTLIACNNESEMNSDVQKPIGWRTLPTYMLNYQYPLGYIETETSNDLSSWSSGYSTGQPSRYGTSSTLYDYDIPDTHRRCLVAYQNSSNQLRSVEYVDGETSWRTPSSLASASSNYLPTVEYNDGVVDEAHVSSTDLSGEYIWSSYIMPGTGWSTSAYLYYSTGFGFSKIPSNYSPCLEFHESAWVEYLVTAVISGGVGIPKVYWRSGSSLFNITNAPSISLGTNSPSERNSSCTAVALTDGNNDDQLYIFYTDPGESSSGDKEIKFVRTSSITGSGDGSISSWNSTETISGAYTNNKIDGFFDYSNHLLVIIFRNSDTGYVDVAFSDDYGDNWDLSITDIAETLGAPSIARHFD